MKRMGKTAAIEAMIDAQFEKAHREGRTLTVIRIGRRYGAVAPEATKAKQIEGPPK